MRTALKPMTGMEAAWGKGVGVGVEEG